MLYLEAKAANNCSADCCSLPHWEHQSLEMQKMMECKSCHTAAICPVGDMQAPAGIPARTQNRLEMQPAYAGCIELEQSTAKDVCCSTMVGILMLQTKAATQQQYALQETCKHQLGYLQEHKIGLRCSLQTCWLHRTRTKHCKGCVLQHNGWNLDAAK